MKKICNTNLNTVAKRIRYSRQRKGLTMQELADTMHKKYQTVQQYEKGIRNPKQKMIEEIAKGLEVSPIFLRYGGYELNEDKDVIHMSICVDRNFLEKDKDNMYSDVINYKENFVYTVNADCVIIAELIKRINNSNKPEYISLIRKACDLAMKSIDKNYNEGMITIDNRINEEMYARKTRKK